MTKPTMTTRGLLRATGLLVWGFAGLPAVASIVDHPSVGLRAIASWAGAFVVFGIAFFSASRADAPEGRAAARMLLVQTAAALAMNVVLCTGFELALVVVVAVELGLLLPLALGVPWLLAQMVLAALLAIHHMGERAGGYWSIVVVGTQGFGFIVAAMAGREAASRRVLEATNATLEATRESLAHASRDAERLRIARELHDILGHDLIALHLELETARHLADDRTKGAVERAHGIAKRLLGDVRKAVSDLRATDGPIDVTRDVRAIVDGVREPKVHLDVPESLGIADAESANTVVRCVQEIVTNTIKHAAAENLWIAIAADNGKVELTARDDGRGAAELPPAPGVGLVGMRERVERLGGALSLEARPGSGFRVRATLPASRA
jgi:signal transduction histidine kinase